MTTTKTRRSHARIVFECYMAIREAERENDSDKLLRVMSRYGKKTREEAIERLTREAAESMGMTYEEFQQSLKEGE